MTLKIHDTLTRRKVDFVPLDDSHVRLYVCGPTVYDFAHIGNARPVVVFDVLVRLLRRLYPPPDCKVTYVRNITDVDDKINAAAKDTGEDIGAITERTTAAFHADMAALGALEPDAEPRATGHIDQMIAMIADLIAKGHAYEAEGHVLFDVPSMPDYGCLSKLDQREIVAGARVDVAPYKKDPSDFVLWKPSTPDLPGWDSPWGRTPENPTGRGRPGWHIECSVMSRELLGDAFDIHGGGQDLIFPHHENEIAQSTCALGPGSFAKYWMHNGYLMAEGEKMSKSLGNFYTVHELLDEFPGEAIRLLLLKTHYRQPLDFTKEGLSTAKRELDYMYRALLDVSDIDAVEVDTNKSTVATALKEDLNTPEALTRLRHDTHRLNILPSSSRDDLAKTKGNVLLAASLLGLLEQDPEDWFRWAPKGAAAVDDGEIDALVAARIEARKSRNFARADEIRDHLAEQGVILEDGADGTTWRRG